MDEGLFTKYLVRIQNQIDSKKEIIDFITEKTGVVLESEEIELSKKEIKIHTTSVKKSKLIQKKVGEVIKEKGYSVLM